MDTNSSFQERKGWLFAPEKSGSVSKALFDLKPEFEARLLLQQTVAGALRQAGFQACLLLRDAGFQSFLPLCGLASILSAFLAALVRGLLLLHLKKL